MKLKAPQTRESSEPFYPSLLELGSRIDQALKSAIAEMYLQGVSIRRVTHVMEELCGLEVTSTQVSRLTAKLDESFAQSRCRPLSEISHLILDATYIKVRVDSSVRDCAVLLAIGIHREGGKRMILGVSVALSEAEVYWRVFLSSLRERGIGIRDLVTSDAHEGLKSALKATLNTSPWQRCQFHLQQNAQAYVPKVSMRQEHPPLLQRAPPRRGRHASQRGYRKNTLNPLLAWPNGWKMPSPRVSRYSLSLKLFANGCELQTCAKHSTLNTQHSTLNTQHSTLNTQHSTLNTQHSTLNSNGEPKSPAFSQTKPLFCASSRLSSWVSPRNGNPEKPTFPSSKPTN
jgi:hypothetical protein